MHSIIHKLINSDEPVEDYFKTAIKIWKDILQKTENSTIEELAQEISNRHVMEFELNCGRGETGQEIKIWSIFGYFYDKQIGFEKTEAKIKRIYKAIKLMPFNMQERHIIEDVFNFYFPMGFQFLEEE